MLDLVERFHREVLSIFWSNSIAWASKVNKWWMSWFQFRMISTFPLLWLSKSSAQEVTSNALIDFYSLYIPFTGTKTRDFTRIRLRFHSFYVIIFFNQTYFRAFVGFNIKFGFEYASKKLTAQKKNDIILGLKLVREKTIPVVHNIQRFLIEKIVGNQNVKSSWAGGNPTKGHSAFNPAFDEDVEIEVGCSVRGQMLNN